VTTPQLAGSVIRIDLNAALKSRALLQLARRDEPPQPYFRRNGRKTRPDTDGGNMDGDTIRFQCPDRATTANVGVA
jgi:hypothetical protein